MPNRRAMTPDDLKTTRATLALTQQQLAETIGVTVSTIAKWEQGIHPIPPMAATLLRRLTPARRATRSLG